MNTKTLPGSASQAFNVQSGFKLEGVALKNGLGFLPLGLLMPGIALTVGAADLPSGYTADFESPAYTSGSIHGQQGWWVDQGNASVVDGAGVNGSLGLLVEAASPYSQARLTLGRPLLAAQILYFDCWVRLPPAPWLVLDETFDIDGARIGLFSSPSLLGVTEWHVFNGDGTGGVYWLGTGVPAPVDQGLGITKQFARVTVELESPT